MEITSAKFVISNSRADKCPEGNLPEYAFIGRSHQYADQSFETGYDLVYARKDLAH